jgi:hypothetical protein
VSVHSFTKAVFTSDLDWTRGRPFWTPPFITILIVTCKLQCTESFDSSYRGAPEGFICTRQDCSWMPKLICALCLLCLFEQLLRSL